MGTVTGEALKATAEKVAQVLALRSPGVVHVSEHFALGVLDVLVYCSRQYSTFTWSVQVVQRLPQGPVEVCFLWNDTAGSYLRDSPLLAGMVDDVQQALVLVLRPGWE